MDPHISERRTTIKAHSIIKNKAPINPLHYHAASEAADTDPGANKVTFTSVGCDDQTTRRCFRPSAVNRGRKLHYLSAAHMYVSIPQERDNRFYSERRTERRDPGQCRPPPPPLLPVIHAKFNHRSPADLEALQLKAARTLHINYDTLGEYFAAHRKIRSEMLAASYPAIIEERTTIKFIIR